ncbi:MAG TPA: MmgE/PrpD family protein [Acetobacteraceae bacterium]|nr:MmgE/PrpD family protein [Acetobacteraceae bacterium]
MTEGLTAALVEKARATGTAPLPDEVRALARQCVLDTLGCALAGSTEALTRILLDEAVADGGAQAATVIGHATRLPVAAAALVNGAAGHALDFDDVNLAMPGHPSVAILPGLLALAESTGASGAATENAFVAGYELACRAGRLIAPGHYDGLGFHATATVGALGAAAACAHLLQLDPERFAAAIGIAATQAAGLKSMFGTMCKPLHAGNAAALGLRAARLAARGFTSRTDAIECAQGFARTHSPDFRPDAALADPAGGFYIRANLFKYHAACYLTHAPIEAARKLREEHGIAPGQIARIRLGLNEACDRVCNIPRPRTGLEAKFSLRLTTAMALAGIETGALASYSDAMAADPVLVALRDKVVCDFVPQGSHTRATVRVELTDGRVLTAEHDAGVPSADVAAQGRRVEAKFRALAEPVLGVARAGDIAGLVARFDKLASVAELVRLAATRG